jgi:hypothetical protein
VRLEYHPHCAGYPQGVRLKELLEVGIFVRFLLLLGNLGNSKREREYVSLSFALRNSCARVHQPMSLVDRLPHYWLVFSPGIILALGALQELG